MHGKIAQVLLFQKRYSFLWDTPFLTKFLILFCHRLLKKHDFFSGKKTKFWINVYSSQLGFAHTIFVELFRADLLKKNQNFIICLCRDIHKINYVSKIRYFKKLVSRFSQKLGSTTHLQRHSTKVRYKVKYFFLFERA